MHFLTKSKLTSAEKENSVIVVLREMTRKRTMTKPFAEQNNSKLSRRHYLAVTLRKRFQFHY